MSYSYNIATIWVSGIGCTAYRVPLDFVVNSGCSYIEAVQPLKFNVVNSRVLHRKRYYPPAVLPIPYRLFTQLIQRFLSGTVFLP